MVEIIRAIKLTDVIIEEVRKENLTWLTFKIGL